MDTLMTPQEVADHLRIAPRTLETWRYRGQGPVFVRLESGAVRYRLADLESYLESRRTFAISA